MRDFLKWTVFAVLADWTYAAPLLDEDFDEDEVLDQEFDFFYEQSGVQDETLSDDPCAFLDSPRRHKNMEDSVQDFRNILHCWTKLMEDEKRAEGDESGLRALIKSDMGLVNMYGCWCYFEDDVGYGAGTPVDELDTICQTLHKNYECILHDHGEEACTPWEITYNSAFGSGFTPFGLTMINLVSECEAQNPGNQCAIDVCKTEGWFVMSYFTYAIFGGEIDNANRHSSGFDPHATCGRKVENPPAASPIFGTTTVAPTTFTANGGGNGGNATPTDPSPSMFPTNDCCGLYPLRFPYVLSNLNNCCLAEIPVKSLTYNPQLLVCCADGSTPATNADC